MNAEKVIKSGQEQAVASWINYLNQVRLDKLVEALSHEEANLEKALATIENALTTIEKDIVFNGKGRGGTSGMHGFIAEIAECGVENAQKQIEGKATICKWINDNGVADLKRGSVSIQQKFVNSGGHLSLQAVKEHLQKYPDFLENGGVYQIPEDHYEKIKWLLSISEDEANKMPTSNGEFSMKQWKEVNEFFTKGGVSIDKIEPAEFRYSEVQRGTYEQTLNDKKEDLKDRNQERKNEAYQNSKPTIAEGLKATAVAGLVEGGMTLCISIRKKVKSGKKLKNFDSNDWEEIAKNTGVGTAKGSARGASIYALTNFTATPAAVASAITTASFGVAEQAHLFRKGELEAQEFIENSEMLCLDASVSALSSFAGQILIPIPVLGAVIGNTVGTMMYQVAKDNLSAREQEILMDYIESIQKLDTDLQTQYAEFLVTINEDAKKFITILDKAFVPDISMAFSGSVELANACGVPTEEILDSSEKIRSYFLN